MPTCVTCFCTVSHRNSSCRRCSNGEPSYNCADLVDVYECIACDSPICIIHASQEQMQRQLCHACFDAYRDDEFGYGCSDTEINEMLGGEAFDASESEIEEFSDDEPWATGRLPTRDAPAVPPPTYVTPTTGNTHDKCAICLDDMHDRQVISLPCTGDHMFHTECIQSWLGNGSADCPLCRTRVNVLLQPVTC